MEADFSSVYSIIYALRGNTSDSQLFLSTFYFLSARRELASETPPTLRRNPRRVARRSPFPYYIPYFHVGTGGRKPTRKFFRKRAVLFGKLAANRAFRPSLEEKTIQKIERQPI